MKYILVLILFTLVANVYPVEYDFCYKEVAADDGETGLIIFNKAKDSNWSDKEEGNVVTGLGETLRVITLDVSDTDFADMTTTTGVEWYVNLTTTPTSITITALVLP